MKGKDVHNEASIELKNDRESQYRWYYVISRAFIPPWSFVITKLQTLGPDAFTLPESRNPSLQ